MRVVTTDAAGASVTTDMPIEFGGSGDQLTSGWLLRAALASCLATRIAMTAAVEGIELDSLEVHTRSQSDARGLMGMSETDGRAVPTEPREFELLVNIVAKGVSPERLRALVKTSESLSPVSEAMRHAVPVTVRVPPESE